jgi:hypothetical protein
MRGDLHMGWLREDVAVAFAVPRYEHVMTLRCLLNSTSVRATPSQKLSLAVRAEVAQILGVVVESVPVDVIQD